MKRAVPFLISAAITATIMVTLSFFIKDGVQAKGTLVSGLIATTVIAAIPIYNIDQWSLFTRSAVHFLLMLITVLPLLLYGGWFAPIMTIIIFLLFGIGGWALGYIVYKMQIKSTR